MTALAPYAEWFRTFGTTNGLEYVPGIARQLKKKVAVGAWLGREDTAAEIAANQKQISSLIAIGKAGQADILIVGSEVLLRSDLTEVQLLGYIKQVKKLSQEFP